MDIKKVKSEKKSILNKKLTFLIFPLAVALILRVTLFNDEGVKRDSFTIAEVKKEPLNVEVKGFGQLRSARQVLLSADSTATVQEIMLLPGSEVNVDQVILQLQNHDLLADIAEAQKDFQSVQANYRKLKLDQKIDILRETTDLEEIKSQLSTVSVRSEAEKKLLKSGIVSSLTHQETLQEKALLIKKLELKKQLLTQLKGVHKEVIEIEQGKLDFSKRFLSHLESSVEKLQVKSSINGILHELDVEVGERLPVGKRIGIVGSADDLIAILKVPQIDAESVAVGQSVKLKLRQKFYRGEVIRVDPVVVDNNVTVDVVMSEKLPEFAKPNQSVSGSITVANLQNVTYIEKPTGAQPFTRQELFKLNEDERRANRVSVQYGEMYGTVIQVLEGARPGERFIVSNFQSLSTKSDLEIN